MALTLRTLLFSIFFILSSINTKAQPRIGQSIKASIGFASSSSIYIENYGNQDEIDVMGSGLYLQAEYIIGIKSWFGVRPYIGMISTKVDKNQPLLYQPQYKVTTQALLVGGKIRFCAPIPWIAPFIEGGIGASIGSFQTFTPSSNFNKKDILLHIPLSIGLAIGKKHNVELAISGYLHPAAEQSSGIFAAGLSFPID